MGKLEMEKLVKKGSEVVGNLEALDIQLEGLASVLRLMAEANLRNEDGFNEDNGKACDFLADVVDHLNEKLVKSSVKLMFNQDIK